jgi:phosphatidylserine/phosphatidylglycerophosphate/cardiolipin synthase-like enzyme
MEPPKYFGTKTGKVIQLIVDIGGAEWEDLIELPDLSRIDLKKIIDELLNNNELYNKFGTFYVSSDLYWAYRNYENNTKKSENIKDNFSEKINAWLSTIIDSNTGLLDSHYYLEGTYIDQFTRFVIDKGTKDILVINPYIMICHLTDHLIEAKKRGLNVTIITRDPSEERDNYSSLKQECHKILSDNGITIYYKKNIHAKILVVDNDVAIVSSMNFYAGSIAGKTWESGIVSVNKEVVNSVKKSIIAQKEKSIKKE